MLCGLLVCVVVVVVTEILVKIARSGRHYNHNKDRLVTSVATLSFEQQVNADRSK